MKKPPDNLWFPSLLQSSNNVNSNSWFNILQKNNNNSEIINKTTINTTYTKTMKFPIYPSDKQKIILDKMFIGVIDMYNIIVSVNKIGINIHACKLTIIIFLKFNLIINFKIACVYSFIYFSNNFRHIPANLDACYLLIKILNYASIKIMIFS